MTEIVTLSQDFKPRDYQKRIVDDAGSESALIVLPTGLGKTAIAAMLMVKHLNEGKLALFLAPTKPLAEQQAKAIDDIFAGTAKVKIATGETPPEKRRNLWTDFMIMVCTPQTAFNDLSAFPSIIHNFGIVVFDEAHRATGEHSYVSIRRLFGSDTKTRFIGLTASPGSEEMEAEIMENLRLSLTVRGSFADAQIRKYTHRVDIEAIRLRRPETLERARFILDSIYARIISELKDLGYSGISGRKDILKGIREASGAIGSGDASGFTAMNLLVTALRIDYAREYAETQGFDQLNAYIRELLDDETPSVRKSIAKLNSMDEMAGLLDLLNDPASDRSNPKLVTICRLCSEQAGRSRVIVFAHYRNTGEIVTSYLNSNCPGVTARAFFGQGPRGREKGMSQKDQAVVIDAFRKGEFNVLVATSVGEEGLDIPDTDLIIFYEPVPSEIRTIQRRGRTGRFRPGSVKILMFQDGREIPYYYMSVKSITSGKKVSAKKKRVSLDDF